MGTDAVQNQKVFVTLKGVLNLQVDYEHTFNSYNNEQTKDKGGPLANFYRGRLTAYEEMIKTLQLPITLKPHS